MIKKKKKKKKARDESMPRKCILVVNLLTELCGSRRGDATVTKESLSYQKDAPRCQERSENRGELISERHSIVRIPTLIFNKTNNTLPFCF